MPRRAMHTAVGIAAGMIAVAALNSSESDGDRFVEVIGGALGGYLGGVMPDGLDLPSSPNHRSVAHGGLAIAALIRTNWADVAGGLRSRASACTAASIAPGCPPDRIGPFQWEALACRLAAGFVIGIAAGYSSHLALDFCTPRSLPLIG